MTLEALQAEWNTLYRTTLPTLAREKHTSKSASSPSDKWPVVLDHCFARIILDNAVGKDQPWTSVVKAPATKNMTESQITAALEMGHRIADGQEDLWALDEKSLQLRGKQPKGAVKRKRDEKEEPKEVKKTEFNGDDVKSDTENHTNGDSHAGYQGTNNEEPAPKSRKGEVAEMWSKFSPASIKATDKEEADSLIQARKLIAADANSKPFRKHVLTLLTQVPRGSYTTYQALSDAAVRFDPKHAGKEQKDARGSARAIGGAMRDNPFAPTVPCHRVLASSGRLGGFKGSWGEDGKFADEKKRLLREEGVKFDGTGKVVGRPFEDFWSYR